MSAEPSPTGNHSGQWGLSSILLSSLIIMLFPLMILLLFVAMYGAYEDPFVESKDIDLGVLGIWVVTGGLFVISMFAMFSGIRGLNEARRYNQSRGLALGGTILSVVAVGAALVLLLVTARSVEWVRALQKTRFGPDRIERPFPEDLRRK